MKTKISMIACVAILFFSGCAVTKTAQPTQVVQVEKIEPIVLTQLSEKIIGDYNLNPERLMNVQYFNGSNTDTLVLRRVEIEKNDTIIDGKLITYNLEKIFIVRINPFTKGKLLNLNNKLMAISFENEDLSLIFGPDSKGNYLLYGIKGENRVDYGGYEYDVVSSGNGRCKLFINLDQIKQFIVNKRIATGIEVGQ